MTFYQYMKSKKRKILKFKNFKPIINFLKKFNLKSFNDKQKVKDYLSFFELSYLIRKISEDEKKSLKILCQGAAMRFLLTRVFDYLNLREGAIVKIKDPVEYLKRLEFHNSVKNYEDY